jgi:uncharacterized protein (DUF433 family)
VNANQKARLECFRSTRVPVQSLIDFLERGETIDQFLELHPAITRGQWWPCFSRIFGELTV